MTCRETSYVLVAIATTSYDVLPRAVGFPPLDINGASAIVPGGASGIGAAVARQLAAKGAKVVVADLNSEKGEELAGEIGGVSPRVEWPGPGQTRAPMGRAGELGRIRARVNSA